MDRCHRCLWSDQCYAPKNDCDDYSPADDDEAIDDMIEEGLYEFRNVWWVYTEESHE